MGSKSCLEMAAIKCAAAIILLCAMIAHATDSDIEHKDETIVAATTLVSTDPVPGPGSSHHGATDSEDDSKATSVLEPTEQLDQPTEIAKLRAQLKDHAQLLNETRKREAETRKREAVLEQQVRELMQERLPGFQPKLGQSNDNQPQNPLRVPVEITETQSGTPAPAPAKEEEKMKEEMKSDTLPQKMGNLIKSKDAKAPNSKRKEDIPAPPKETDAPKEKGRRRRKKKDDDQKKKKGGWLSFRTRTMDLDEFEETGKRISSSIYNPTAQANRGHMFCKERWKLVYRGKNAARCGACIKGAFLLPDLVIGKMKQVGTCHMLSSYKRWIRAKLLASQGKQKSTKCYKSYSNYGRYRDPKTALITRKNRLKGTPKKNLGFICVGADFIPQDGIRLYHKRAYYSQIRMIKATFAACHNKDFNKRDLTCTKVTHSGPCKRSTIRASSPQGASKMLRKSKDKEMLYLPIGQAAQRQWEATGELPTGMRRLHPGAKNRTPAEVDMWNWLQAAKGITEKVHDGVSSLPAELDQQISFVSNMGVNKCTPVEKRMWMAQF